jgi:uncharacterized damage-inducible protein DinB
MKAHFEMLARYNQWVNTKLYSMAAALPDEAYRRNVGAFFRSLHGTLNHLLTADRIWLRRLTHEGDHPKALDAIVFDDLPALRAARESDDLRLIRFVEQLPATQFEQQWDYQTMNGTPQRQPIREILAHVFNHQAHHRGQAHAILTILGVNELEPWDLLIMQRQTR